MYVHNVVTCANSMLIIDNVVSQSILVGYPQKHEQCRMYKKTYYAHVNMCVTDKHEMGTARWKPTVGK